ncbi:MAG: exosortase [Verrucomicrobiales bacterium]|jgi:exosortase|nr:exosortase [Verrucomicrobiales bacterium]
MQNIAAESAPAQRPSLIAEVRAFCQTLPNGWLYLALLAVWVTLFHVVGNSVFGYIDTPSLFQWLIACYRGSDDDSHGALVPIVILVLLWWKHNELQLIPKRTWWPALGLVILALFIHVVGYLIQQTRISAVGFFFGVYALTGLVWGPIWLKRTFFPMFLLAFSIPVSSITDPVTFPLRMLVSKVAVAVAHGPLGIDVIREGSLIFDPKHTFQYDVAAPCSGMRSLMALLAISTIYSFLTFKSNWKRLLLVASAVPFAVAANVVRVTSVIVAGEAFGQQAGAFIEQKLGFLTFGVAIGGMILLGYLLRHWFTSAAESTPIPA